jgi:hypothetical protein
MTGQELRGLLKPLIDDCSSGDPGIARPALLHYLHHVRDLVNAPPENVVRMEHG